MARKEYESPAVAAAARRMIRALVRRANAGDTEALEGLRSLEVEVPQYVTEAMAGLHGFGYSWAEIGTVAGITRQGARQRVEQAVDEIGQRGRGRVDLDVVVEEWRQRLEPACTCANGCASCAVRLPADRPDHGHLPAVMCKVHGHAARGGDDVVALEQADAERPDGVRSRVEVLRDARDLADAQGGDPDTLGPCGCVDYHMSDCPIRTDSRGTEPVDLYDDDAYMRDLP